MMVQRGQAVDIVFHLSMGTIVMDLSLCYALFACFRTKLRLDFFCLPRQPVLLNDRIITSETVHHPYPPFLSLPQ